MLRPLLLPLAGVLLATPALAAGSGVVGANLLWLALILMAARLFSPLAARFGFPAVLGELLLGIALGNLMLVGIHGFEKIAQDLVIAFIAELGVIVLLLQIGLETRLADPQLLAIGLGMTVVSDAMFSVVVMMVILTTLMTPPILTGLLRRSQARKIASCSRLPLLLLLRQGKPCVSPPSGLLCRCSSRA